MKYNFFENRKLRALFIGILYTNIAKEAGVDYYDSLIVARAVSQLALEEL